MTRYSIAGIGIGFFPSVPRLVIATWYSEKPRKGWSSCSTCFSCASFSSGLSGRVDAVVSAFDVAPACFFPVTCASKKSGPVASGA